MTQVESAVRNADGGKIATLRVGRLPRRSDELGLEDERIVVQEEGTYLFEVNLPGENQIQVNPGSELFSFDDASNMRGRLLPKQHVGRINVAIRGFEPTDTSLRCRPTSWQFGFTLTPSIASNTPTVRFAAPSTDQLDLAVEEEEVERLARSKREDLLKMHAYRDAIRRSAGAYVLYPGDQHQMP